MTRKKTTFPIRLKGLVTKNHLLIADVPEDVPPGEYIVEIFPPTKKNPDEGSAKTKKK